jgi:hypothetical protein
MGGLPAVLAIYASVLGGLVWIAHRVRRRGGGASLMGPFEEIWHPAAHQAHLEIEVQDGRPEPAPAPGGRLL